MLKNLNGLRPSEPNDLFDMTDRHQTVINCFACISFLTENVNAERTFTIVLEIFLIYHKNYKNSKNGSKKKAPM